MQPDTGEPAVWAPEGEAEARRLLLNASCQTAMVRFRQGHRGQASWVPSQEPGSSQLTMATRAAAAEPVHTLPAGGWRRGGELRPEGDLWYGDSCSSMRKEVLLRLPLLQGSCHFLHRSKRSSFRDIPPSPPEAQSQDTAVGTSHLSTQDCPSQ